MFLTNQKSPHQFYRIPQEKFIPSLVRIGAVVSEEKSFEKLLVTMTDNNDNRQRQQQSPSDGNSSQGL